VLDSSTGSRWLRPAGCSAVLVMLGQLRWARCVGSGRTSVRSLAKYARVSVEALERHQAERDPARRRQP
jgi:hypothetical protein